MKNTILLLLTIISIACNTAKAEFVLGGQTGISAGHADVVRIRSNGTRSTRPWIGNESGNVLGLFGQFRHTISDDVLLGVHLGYVNDSTEWERVGDFSTDSIDFHFEADDVYDVMGLVGLSGKKVNPFVMFGFSAMRVEANYSGVFGAGAGSSYNDEGKETLTGWKLGIGAEHRFTDKLIGYVLLHYADYGKVTFFDGSNTISRREFDVQQSGLSFGVGYSF